MGLRHFTFATFALLAVQTLAIANSDSDIKAVSVKELVGDGSTPTQLMLGAIFSREPSSAFDGKELVAVGQSQEECNKEITDCSRTHTESRCTQIKKFVRHSEISRNLINYRFLSEMPAGGIGFQRNMPYILAGIDVVDGIIIENGHKLNSTHKFLSVDVNRLENEIKKCIIDTAKLSSRESATSFTYFALKGVWVKVCLKREVCRPHEMRFALIVEDVKYLKTVGIISEVIKTLSEKLICGRQIC